jgi:Xaa-Pro aminopeptidase
LLNAGGGQAGGSVKAGSRLGEKPLFSSAEMRRRRAAFGAAMARCDVPYALVYGANRAGSAVSWLTGWPVTREALLVAGPEPEDDVLLVSFYNHLPQARRLSCVSVEWAGERAMATALAVIAARGRLPERVGLAGPVPFGQYRMLAEQVAEVSDLGAAYTALRLVKSGEEVAALRRAAALTDDAVAALARALRPGATEHEVIAEVEHAYVAHGGLHHIHYLATTPMGEPARSVPAQWPAARRVRAGDAAVCEISAAAAPDYAGQLLRTFTVQADPTPLYADLHAVAAAAFGAVSRRLVPGVTASDLAAAGRAVIAGAGFAGVDDLVHGFGGGYLPPVIPAPGRDVPVPDFTLAAGMTVVVQPNVVTPDRRAGVQTGELLLVTDHGPERLHAFPPGLLRAGAAGSGGDPPPR